MFVFLFSCNKKFEIKYFTFELFLVKYATIWKRDIFSNNKNMYSPIYYKVTFLVEHQCLALPFLALIAAKFWAYVSPGVLQPIQNLLLLLGQADRSSLSFKYCRNCSIRFKTGLWADHGRSSNDSWSKYPFVTRIVILYKVIL